MGKPGRRLKPIPSFASIREEAEFWDTHDTTEYDFQPTDDRVALGPGAKAHISARRRGQQGYAKKRSPFAMGAAPEEAIVQFLQGTGVAFERHRQFDTAHGRWECDFFIPGRPPVVIECKNPTAQAQSPAGSVLRKAQEALLSLTVLSRFCPALPPSTLFIVVHGNLPLAWSSPQFGKRDYAQVIRAVIGDRCHVVPAARLDELTDLLKAHREA